MEKNKQVQEKYLELKLLEKQINQIQQQISIFNNQIMEFRELIQNLNTLKQTKQDTEIFSSLGAGIFIKAEIKDTKEVLMNVGSNTFVTKNIEEADKLVNKQITDITDAIKQFEYNLQEAAERAQQLEKEIMTLSAKNK